MDAATYEKGHIETVIKSALGLMGKSNHYLTNGISETAEQLADLLYHAGCRLVMNGEVLVSIQPQWCRRINQLIKTTEVRKSKPTIQVPFKAYIYMTMVKGGVYGFSLSAEEEYRMDGKVIGEFVCREIETYPWCEAEGRHIISDAQLHRTCLTVDELTAYGRGQTLYGWRVSDLQIYDESKPLAAYRKKGVESYDVWKRMFFPDKCSTSREEYQKQITPRPPQSWCYVEAINE